MAMVKEKTISIAGTVAFHVLLIVCLLLYYIKPADQNRYSEELGGVPVMFGNVRDAYGDDEPFGRGNGMTEDITEPIESDPTMPNYLDENVSGVKETVPEKKATPTTPTKETKAPSATQDVEKTIAVSETKKAEAEQKRKEAAEAEIKRKAQAEAERRAREEEERKKNINSQMAGLFGNGTGSGSRGNTHGTGTQGSPAGNGSVGKVSGVGGKGSYDLGGRGIGSGGLILPAYSVDDYGTVVVDIIVDPKGNVIEATIGKGTTTSNSTLRNESIRAAKRTKFNTVTTSNNQKGTITYRFNLN